MNGASRTRTACSAGLAAVLAFLCAVSPLALAQRRQSRPEPPQRFEQPRNERGAQFGQQAPRRQNNPGRQGEVLQQNRQQRQQNPNVRRPQANNIPQYRGQENPTPQMRIPGDRGPLLSQPGFARPGNPGGQGNVGRPGYSSFPAPVYAPSGHLGAWLNEHRGVPVQQQEQMLRRDPSFSRLPQSDQQRLMRQLNRVDQMPEAQRERRLARAEALERLSPQDRTQVNMAARRWATMPAGRQTLMRQAFRDLRGVPPDQRATVLNSERYRNAFTPEERGVLSDVLRVEPYEPPR